MAGNIIAWIKANLLIVISTALIVILLPAGWFFSNSWNNSIQEKAQKAYGDEKRRLSSASSVQYSLPAVLKDEQGLSESRAPNKIVTQFYTERKAIRELQVNQVIQRGTSFNQEHHPVPVDGLLPEAESPSELRKLGFRLGQKIAGTEETPSLYTLVLRKLNAGDAPDPEALASSLKQYKEQQQQAYAATSPDGRVSSDDNKQLEQDLIRRRLSEYAGRAESIAFYCPLSSIQAEKPESTYSHVPAQIPGYDSVTEHAVYTWIWDYWIISDVLRAVAKANTDQAGVSLAVPLAPVKHIEQIRVSEFAQSIADLPIDDPVGRTGRSSRSRNDPPATIDDSSEVKSHTGRDQSDAFDVRYVEVSLIASSQDLPLFIDALGKQNYMTVIDLDLDQVDVYEALTNGYYYGDDHLVRAHIKIETIWLRSWTVPLMPESVRTALDIPIEQDPDLDDG